MIQQVVSFKFQVSLSCTLINAKKKKKKGQVRRQPTESAPPLCSTAKFGNCILSVTIVHVKHVLTGLRSLWYLRNQTILLLVSVHRSGPPAQKMPRITNLASPFVFFVHYYNILSLSSNFYLASFSFFLFSFLIFTVI